jgi:hypothetical protein
LYEHWETVKRLHLPHCADSLVYRDYGLDKDIDVLVTGNLAEHTYPLRHRLFLLATRVLKKRGYRVHVLPHPGYVLPPKPGTVVTKEYAKLLNRARLVFTCSSRYKYGLTKYSEIALCRALAVSDLPDEPEDFYAEAILRVEPFMLDTEILRCVEDALDSENEIERRATRAMDLAARGFTTAHYAERFYLRVRETLKLA